MNDTRARCTLAAYAVSFWVGCAVLLAGPACEESSLAEPPGRAAQGENAMTFTLTSAAFKDGALIPDKYTGEGLDVSPPLEWSEPPSTTKSFALICDDPDAPVGIWVHWVIYDIDAEARGLPEAVPTMEVLKDGARQGVNDFRKIGYNGPMPPPGSVHRYYFKLYALDALMTSLPRRTTKKDLLKAMEGHVLGEAQLMGTYRR